MASLNKRKKSLTLILIFLITLNMISFASSIFTTTSGNFAFSSSENIDSIKESGVQKQSAEPYSIEWGEGMDAAPAAVDIDSHPSQDMICATTGSRIQYCNYSSLETWKNLCFIPDQIAYTERLAVFPALNELQVLFFLVTRSGELYEATSYDIGGVMQWYKHDTEVCDIATSRYLDEAKAISKDGKKLYQYIPSNKTWKTVYTFDKPNWYPYSDADVGYPIRIDTDHYGNAMVLTTKGYIFYYNDEYEWKWWMRGNSGFNKVVSDIAVSEPYLVVQPRVPSAFIVGRGDNDPYSILGHCIYKHNVGSNWYKCNGRLVSITADRNGEPWGINNEGKIFHGKPKGELPDVTCYIAIWLSESTYYDNKEKGRYGEMVAKGYYRDQFITKMRRKGVKDGGTVHWYHVFGSDAFIANNFRIAASQYVYYKVISFEDDIYWNDDDYYAPLVKGLDIKQLCGLGLYRYKAGDNEIVITTYFKINTYKMRGYDEVNPSIGYLVEKDDNELPGEQFLVEPPSIRDSTPNWAVGETYYVGDKVVYNGITYSCLQSHTVYDPNWTPPNTPALWKQE